MHLTTAQLDRAAGTLLASACGDALGARFEFGPPLGPDVDLSMQPGGSFGWARGEWTDDTSMAVAIAEVTATGADLLSREAQDRIVARWADWSKNAKDVGVMTSSVLRQAIRAGAEAPTAADSLAAAADYHYRTGQSAGNGSLMRTAPVALAYLDDPHGLVDAAMALSALTHYDPEAGEACVLWCLAIRHAVLYADFEGLRDGLNHLPPPRAAVWAERLDRAEASVPSDFPHNGWVVEALQGAWSAITTSRSPEGRRDDAHHLERGLEAAVRGGKDTDTVAAIAGSLLGARWGASAVPARWRRVVHGWPGLRARDLIRLGAITARGGEPDGEGWPSGAHLDYSSYGDIGTLARHPLDEGVWLSGVGHLYRLPEGVDAVVSLCRLGTGDVPGAAAGARDAAVRSAVAPEDHLEVWLVDDAAPAKNPNLDFVLKDAASAVRAFRDEGKTVLLHCVQAQSRTPTVAALYGAAITGRAPLDCLKDVQRVLPDAHPNGALIDALGRLE